MRLLDLWVLSTFATDLPFTTILTSPKDILQYFIAGNTSLWLLFLFANWEGVARRKGSFKYVSILIYFRNALCAWRRDIIVNGFNVEEERGLSSKALPAATNKLCLLYKWSNNLLWALLHWLKISQNRVPADSVESSFGWKAIMLFTDVQSEHFWRLEEFMWAPA